MYSIYQYSENIKHNIGNNQYHFDVGKEDSEERLSDY